MSPTATTPFQLDVPIPPPRKAKPKRAAPAPKWPTRTMPVGAAFFVPRAGKHMPSYFHNHGRRIGRKFTIRQVYGIKTDVPGEYTFTDDPRLKGAVPGIGVWRIK